jgi:lanthanide-dependent methanol dehydrogenase
MDRWFKVVDATNGNLLWKFHAGSGIIGQPVSYRGSDGEQYVAILAGVGGWSGALAAANIDPRVRNGALGFVGAMQDLPAYTSSGGEVLVFKVGKPSSQSASPHSEQGSDNAPTH